MGRMLQEAAANDSTVRVVATLTREFSASALNQSDCLIDFTRPEATTAYIDACVAQRCNLVLGTTGLAATQIAYLEQAATEIAIVFAPNMSLGVNVTMRLVQQAARVLGMEADIEVFEAHHKMKVDAPSGTALMLGEAAARARGQTLDSAAVYERAGKSGPREPGTIGFSVVRAGDIIGDHTVTFALAGERIEITHRAASRSTYALGAIRAAKFLADKRSGLFNMQDVLGLSGG